MGKYIIAGNWKMNKLPSETYDYVKEVVDVVIKDDPEEVLKTFEKIYYSYNVEKTIKKISKSGHFLGTRTKITIFAPTL